MPDSLWKPTPLAEARLPEADELQVWRVPIAAAQHREATRTALLILLGKCLGLEPAQVPLAVGAHGKPHLEPGHGLPPLEFNCSHSGGLALIALAREIAVGVDLEQIGRKVDYKGIAARWFTEPERAAWDAMGRRPKTFFKIWSRKEAVLKAHGGGLAAGLDRFSVAAALPQLGVLWPPMVAWEEGTFSVYHLDPDSETVGALAAAGSRPAARLRLFAAL